MDDAEELKWAAKAAGMKLTENGVRDLGEWEWLLDEHGGSHYCNNPNGSQTRWNPRVSDGDALRLAVKLELEIYYGDDEGGTSVHVGYAHDPDSFSMVRYCIELAGTDPYAAARRAIVRAAAEIGRAMK